MPRLVLMQHNNGNMWEPMLLDEDTNRLERVDASYDYASTIAAHESPKYAFLEEFLVDNPAHRRLLYIDLQNLKTATDIETGQTVQYAEFGEYDYNHVMGSKPEEFYAVGLANANTEPEIHREFIATFHPSIEEQHALTMQQFEQQQAFAAYQAWVAQQEYIAQMQWQQYQYEQAMAQAYQMITQPPTIDTSAGVRSDDRIAKLDELIQRAAATVTRTAASAAASVTSESDHEDDELSADVPTRTKSAPPSLESAAHSRSEPAPKRREHRKHVQYKLENVLDIEDSLGDLFEALSQDDTSAAKAAVHKLQDAAKELVSAQPISIKIPEQPDVSANAIAALIQLTDPFADLESREETTETLVTAATALINPAKGERRPGAPTAKPKPRKKKGTEKRKMPLITTPIPEPDSLSSDTKSEAKDKAMLWLRSATDAAKRVGSALPTLTPDQELKLHMIIIGICTTLLLYGHNEISAAAIQRNPRNAFTPEFMSFLLQALVANVALIAASKSFLPKASHSR